MSEHTHSLIHPRYRKDIDGLRAIAVLSVVIYHGFPKALPGGFIGVDIFFIISGFLISTILLQNLTSQNFSFKDFYARRIKRIFPALITILIFSFGCGWFLLLSGDFRQLCRHIFAGVLFFLNFRFWRETGYFDNTSEDKPLLHLWSLGIEEQFYIVWPLLLFSIWFLTKNKKYFLFSILILGSVSFFLNVRSITNSPESSFYLPQMRFWELLMGAGLAYISLYRPTLQKKFISNFCSVLGLALICIGLFTINESAKFPGYWALLPTLGTTLLIYSNNSAWFNHHILSHKILVWFGLISYPLYLWHWPLLSFGHIAGGNLSVLSKMWLLILAVILAWATYKFIEIPLRFGKMSLFSDKTNLFFKKHNVMLLSSSLAFVGLIGIFGFAQKGFKFRFKEKESFVSYFDNHLPDWPVLQNFRIDLAQRFDCNFNDLEKWRHKKATTIPKTSIDPSCYTHNPSKKTVFLWGDSHAAHLFSGLNNTLPQDWEVLMVASSGCGPNPNITSDSDQNVCIRSNWFALEQIKKIQPAVVIVAQNTGHNIDLMKAIENKMNQFHVKKVLFMGPVPHWELDLHKILTKKGFWKSKPERLSQFIDQKYVTNNNYIKQMFQSNQNAQYVDAINFFCNEKGCLTYVGDDLKNEITTYDDAHLTPKSSDYLAQNLLKELIMK